MKFIELKKRLAEKLEQCYLIEGDDRFVVASALGLIEKRVGLAMADVNRVVLEGDSVNIENIEVNANSFPFGDEKRLLIIKEPSVKLDNKKLQNIIKTLPEFMVVVFVSYCANATTKAIKEVAEFVDCSKLDSTTIKGWIGGQLKRNSCTIEERAMEKLLLYTNQNMARIETETQKLISMGEPVISEEMVDRFVVRDKEYQIYELVDYLSKKDSLRAYDLIETMMQTEKNSVGLVQYLYSAFRKLLIITLSKESDEQLAKVFKVKPYSIKMSRIQAGKFSPRQLKKINEELSALEYDLKRGKANQDNAVHIIIAKILLG